VTLEGSPAEPRDLLRAFAEMALEPGPQRIEAAVEVRPSLPGSVHQGWVIVLDRADPIHAIGRVDPLGGVAMHRGIGVARVAVIEGRVLYTSDGLRWGAGSVGLADWFSSLPRLLGVAPLAAEDAHFEVGPGRFEEGGARPLVEASLKPSEFRLIGSLLGRTGSAQVAALPAPVVVEEARLTLSGGAEPGGAGAELAVWVRGHLDPRVRRLAWGPLGGMAEGLDLGPEWGDGADRDGISAVIRAKVAGLEKAPTIVAPTLDGHVARVSSLGDLALQRLRVWERTARPARPGATPTLRQAAMAMDAPARELRPLTMDDFGCV
jgi:hypothetical protein